MSIAALSSADLPNNALVGLCRGGFERECARELTAWATRAGIHECEASASGGFVTVAFSLSRAIPLARWARAWAEVSAVFTREAFIATGPHRLLHESPGNRLPDRVTPLLAAIAASGEHAPYASVWMEYPDTNDGKELTSLARTLQARVESDLREQRALDGANPRVPRLHVLLADGATAWVGTSDPTMNTRWSMGIPRLRMPARAPSRSTLKLAEAFDTFLAERADRLLKPGMQAVDLGAAPGGWTWQLAQRGLHVTAVDNGALRGDIADDPRVRHVRTDGLQFRPRHPVDWLTCDIVEQPSRIASLAAGWIAEGAARHAIFNLKLPMKKRYEEVERCREIIASRMAGVEYTLRLRQLYHDRAEVTGYLTRIPQVHRQNRH